LHPVPTFFFILPFLVFFMLLGVYAERKISAFMQDRLGPMETGPYGTLQTVADFIKLIQKEDIVPEKADRILFKLAPVFIFMVVFAGFSVIPLGPSWAGSGISSGLFFLLAIISLDVIGILIAGWSSNNKYSVLGTLRSAAQLISYEIPLGLSVLCVAMVCQSLDLQEISRQQGILSPQQNYLFGIHAWGIETGTIGGFLTWNIFRMPLLFGAWLIFFISSMAESNRAPFDLPEAESELVAGFQTEYSGFRWAIVQIGEYGMMLLVSFLGVILFFGSWNTPLPNIAQVKLADWTTGSLWGIVWLIGKALFFVAVQIWVRWTFPRLRIDQLMSLSWKYLTPAALIIVVICGFWKLFIA
jgi:NADH-quinone oxidoreductase subunit H